jgi:hypothetical protein
MSLRTKELNDIIRECDFYANEIQPSIYSTDLTTTITENTRKKCIELKMRKLIGNPITKSNNITGINNSIPYSFKILNPIKSNSIVDYSTQSGIGLFEAFGELLSIDNQIYSKKMDTKKWLMDLIIIVGIIILLILFYFNL